MIASVDKSGKLLIPKSIRERFGITPKTKLGIEEEQGKLVIKVLSDEDILVDKDGVLVFRGDISADFDDLVARERDRRLTNLSFWEDK